MTIAEMADAIAGGTSNRGSGSAGAFSGSLSQLLFFMACSITCSGVCLDPFGTVRTVPTLRNPIIGDGCKITGMAGTERFPTGARSQRRSMTKGTLHLVPPPRPLIPSKASTAKGRFLLGGIGVSVTNSSNRTFRLQSSAIYTLACFVHHLPYLQSVSFNTLAGRATYPFPFTRSEREFRSIDYQYTSYHPW